jgi:hypothetical protein
MTLPGSLDEILGVLRETQARGETLRAALAADAAHGDDETRRVVETAREAFNEAVLGLTEALGEFGSV